MMGCFIFPKKEFSPHNEDFKKVFNLW